jgi:hypothetical protein
VGNYWRVVERRFVALADFCAAGDAKTPVSARLRLKPLRSLRGKNRLSGDFLGFHPRGATDSWRRFSKFRWL